MHFDTLPSNMAEAGIDPDGGDISDTYCRVPDWWEDDGMDRDLDSRWLAT